MKCKYCGKERETNSPIVSYKRSEWRGAGNWMGAYEYETEEFTDSGAFCSDKCLFKYLSEKTLIYSQRG